MFHLFCQFFFNAKYDIDKGTVLTKKAKKNLIKETILSENLDILCMQETEINVNLGHNLLTFPGYKIEIKSNMECSRVAFYIRNKINYIRRCDLEGNDSNLIILDMIGLGTIIFNVYRSFAPQQTLPSVTNSTIS